MQWTRTWTSLIPTSKLYLSLEFYLGNKSVPYRVSLWDDISASITKITVTVYSVQGYCTVNSELLGGGMVKWIRAVVPGLNLPPYRHLTLFSEVPSSTPRPRSVVHQLLSLSPAEIVNSLCPFICSIFKFIYSVSNQHMTRKLSFFFFFFLLLLVLTGH